MVLRTLGFVWLGLLGGSTVTGCAPALQDVRPLVNPASAEVRPRSIALLPVRLYVEADDPEHTRPSLRGSADATARATRAVTRALAEEIARRDYSTVRVAWDGSVDGGASGAAIPPDVLANLSDALLAHGAQVASGAMPERDDVGAPIPYFGTDATLHVGGTGHLYEDEPTRERVAKQVAIGLGIALAVVAVVAIVAAIAIASANGGGGGFPKIGSGPSRLGTDAARAAAGIAMLPLRIGATVALHAPHALAAPGLLWLPDGHQHGPGCNLFLGVHDGYPAPIVTGPAHATAAPNFLQLTATLVENRTGRVLWVSGQSMPVDPIDEKVLRQAVAHILGRFPHAPRRLMPAALQ